MVLFQWFERFLGTVAAPDDNYQPPAMEDSPFWSTVAPDPNFSPGGRVLENGARRPHPHRRGGGGGSPEDILDSPAGATPPLRDVLVECQHCHRMTPSSPSPSPTTGRAHPSSSPSRAEAGDGGGREAATVSSPLPAGATFKTPEDFTPSSSSRTRSSPWTGGTPSRRRGGVAETTTPTLEARLLEATLATTALTSTAYKKKQKKADKLFNQVHGVYNDSKHKVLASLIESDPHVLLYARVAKGQGKGLESCEGYTALHTACNRGNGRAVDLMLGAPVDVAMELVQQTTLQGETALHLACSRGHDDIATRLRDFCDAHRLGWQAQDILGRTPLASALLSPNCSSVKKSSLFKALQSPDDVCVYGRTVAPADRSFYWPTSRVAVGISELPGKRGQMEDATLVASSSSSLSSESGGSGTVVLAGVFDGHDDDGVCSQCAAEHVQKLLIPHLASGSRATIDNETAIQDIFQTVDDTIRHVEDSIPGGSTACVAIVTDRLLQVANVGDSRCVLVQRVPASAQDQQGEAVETLDEHMKRLSLSTSDSVTASVNSAPSKGESFTTTHAVVPMSRDHKPELDSEKKRIEAAGLQVVEMRISDTQVVHKVKSSKGTELAMSRSLGDYEFKDTKGLTSDQQAVIATPDVTTRERAPHDEFLIVACDGVWDVMTDAQAAEFVATQLQSFGPPDSHVLARVADRLCRKCFDIGSEDNISVVLVALGETAERLTPEAISSPGSSTDAVPRKLEYESPTVEPPVAAAAGAPPTLDDVQPNPRTPGQVQIL